MQEVNRPLPLKDVVIGDAFWQTEIALIRDRMIPYQWKALNDQVPGAAPSWWMHNMRAAAKAVASRKQGKEEKCRQRSEGMLCQPEDPKHPEQDFFYGWVFQDSDGYKWLEAVSYQLILHPDPALRSQAQEAIDAIAAAQEPDGYLDTYYTLTGLENVFTNLRDNHELYCFGHLVEAAVAWKEATGQKDLLGIAERFADCIASRFGPGKRRGCPGHEIAEMALFRLYEATEERKWLEMANFFLDVRGEAPSTFAEEENLRRKKQGLPMLSTDPARYTYHQANVPVRKAREAVGHAVRQMYLASGMADAARLNGDVEMREACERLWHSTVEEKRYVTGGIGATHVGEAFSRPYDLPSDTAYSETCAAIGLVFFARRMLQLSPESRYADIMEEALYNTVLAGMALDGEHFFYVNPLEVDPDACETDERLQHVKPVRQKWFGCACCPPNIARMVSSLGNYLATVGENTVYFHLYVGCELRASFRDGELKLKMTANLLRHGRIQVTVTEGEGEGTLAFRIPRWTKNPQILAADVVQREENGYVYLTRRWQTGDTVTLDFPMPVRRLSADPRVRELLGQICYTRGPLVYCAEETDNGKNLHLVRVLPEKRVFETETRIGNMDLPALRVPAKRVRLEEAGALYREWQPAETEETEVTLIPYFAWNNRGRGEMRVWLYAD